METALMAAKTLQPGDRVIFGNGRTAEVHAVTAFGPLAVAIDFGQPHPVVVANVFEFRLIVKGF